MNSAKDTREDPPGDEPIGSDADRVDLNPADPATGSSGNDVPTSDSGPIESNAQGLTIGHIGRYALKQRLGEGGLGTVYAAYDPILSRTIAVKTLHLSAVDGDRAALDALFLNEARAAAGLNHPNIVTVYDAGLSEQGVYIAMERLRGRDLRQLLANGWQPDMVQAVQIVRRVADALSYAHSKGVIHCDIKPANVFMVGRTLPKVVDFGIARVAHGQVIPALEGVVAGSPHYLAPEQLRGETIDRRCDVYSLGVVMYELLTHRKAFNGKTLAEIVDAVQHATPSPAHDVRPDVPASLSQIVQRAMAREPQQRYRSARELSRDLRQWLEVEGDLITEEPAPPSLWRRPLVVSTIALGVAGLAGALWWLQAPAGSEPDRPFWAGQAQDSAAQKQATPAVAAASSISPPLAAAVAEPDKADDDASTVLRTATARNDSGTSETRPVSRERPARIVKPPTAASATPPGATAPAIGVVQLAITPWGQIEVDGTSAGVTPPLAKLSLPVGEHVVTVRNDDFPPYTITVRVTADQPVVVRHRFGS